MRILFFMGFWGPNVYKYRKSLYVLNLNYSNKGILGRIPSLKPPFFGYDHLTSAEVAKQKLPKISVIILPSARYVIPVVRFRWFSRYPDVSRTKQWALQPHPLPAARHDAASSKHWDGKRWASPTGCETRPPSRVMNQGSSWRIARWTNKKTGKWCCIFIAHRWKLCVYLYCIEIYYL